MCETTEAILRLAAQGCSKKRTRTLLGIPRSTFDPILEAMGPVAFDSYKNYTVRDFRGSISEILKHFGIDKNPRSIRSRIAMGKSLEDAFFQDTFRAKETVRGFTGTRWDIIKHFGLNTTPGKVAEMSNAGVPLEEAYFLPPRTSRYHYVRDHSTTKGS